MAGKFQWCKFADCNLNDKFFDTLKSDYPDFDVWFNRKAANDEDAFVFSDEEGIVAFLYLKLEKEEIELVDRTLPPTKRLKIGTLKLAERYHGQRLGEGAIGIALWHWQEERTEEVYVTVFKKHKPLINLLERFGFRCAGILKRSGECVYLRSRKEIDYSDPYKAFPFLNPDFLTAGLIPINEKWHDTLFPFSELKRTKQEVEEIAAANGITKVYIGTPTSSLHHTVGEPVIIYRISSKEPKKYYSAATSYCVITDVTNIKSNWTFRMNLDQFLQYVGNKSVFSREELIRIYNKKCPNIVMFEMVYNGVFGKGHNVNHNKLRENGFWFDTHPYLFKYSKEQFVKILEMGGKDVHDVIID